MTVYFLDGPVKGQLRAYPKQSWRVDVPVFMPSTAERYNHDDNLGPVYTVFQYGMVGSHEGIVVMSLRP